MAVTKLILIETSSPGNLGAALRVAANFGVPEVALVRPVTDLSHPDFARWACGAGDHLEVRTHASLEEAAAECRTLVATASGRGRDTQPLVSAQEAGEALATRGPQGAALVFGSETSGMRREDLDRCDLVVRIPTEEAFPVLNLTQAVAILLAHLSWTDLDPAPARPAPARHDTVSALMDHLHSTLLDIGYLDPQNPERILRKIRRLLGRAGVTDNEVAILRGACRQIDWASRRRARRFSSEDPADDSTPA